jgi:uncharacterized membrane protein
MLSERFRRQLRQEAQTWQADGLISNDQFSALSTRYQFDRLELQSKNLFTLILLTIGGVLIGLGVITFVAANWGDIPRIARVILLLSLFLGISVGGFTLWRQAGFDRWQHRLGETLLLLGSLILGANIALMAQMFHIGGAPYGLFLTWGIGVLLMAYGLRIVSLGMLAVLLMGIGYWQGYWEVSYNRDFSLMSLLIYQMPIAAAVLFLPLAYWCRSRVLFTFSAIAVSSSLLASLTNTVTRDSALPAILLILPAALLWSYDDTIWSVLSRRTGEAVRPFQTIARRLAVLYLGGLFYWISFHWGWTTNRSSFWYSPVTEWHSMPSVVILSGVAIAQWLYLLRFARNRSGRIWFNLNTVAILAFIVITGIVNFWHLRVNTLPSFAPFIFNLFLALLSIGTLRNSLATGERRAFWFSIVFIILQIVSRLLEYDTNLLLKALVFVLCGVGVIVAGLWFERYVRTLTPAIRE